MGSGEQGEHDADVAAMTMHPSCGERLVRYVGDTLRFALRHVPVGHCAVIRTDIGRASELRQGIIQSIQEPEVQLEAGWRDVPMQNTADGWAVSMALTEVGWFQSKAYTLDADGQQHWPDGAPFCVKADCQSHLHPTRGGIEKWTPALAKAP